MLEKLKHTYNNQTIHRKFLLLIASIMLVSFSLLVFSMQQVLHVYDDQIYSKSSQVLSTSSNSIENELNNIADVSFGIGSDLFLHNYLQNIDEIESEYEKFILHNELKDKLMTYLMTENYILSVHIIARNGDQLTIGNEQLSVPNDIRETIVQAAVEYNGTNRWLHHLDNRFQLVATREIRSYRDLGFNHLGTISIRVNLDKIVGNLLDGSQVTDGDFYIVDDQAEVIYATNDEVNLKNEIYPLETKSGYQVQTIQGKKQFIVHKYSKDSGWTYVNVIPFNQIFKQTNVAKTVVFILYVLILLICVIIGLSFTRNITLPLKKLAANMKFVETGNFKEAKEQTLQIKNIHQDEVGQLHESFLTMIDQIDELIYENYSKQITIKETEFKALQAQINPHFLYNTLESINWMAKSSGQKKISEMVEALGYLLRNSIQVANPLVSIKEELAFVEKYIVIQKFRFDDRLLFECHIDSKLMRESIPKLTLQPLVENAIHYAVEKMIEPCHIKIYAKKYHDYFVLIVEDDGPGMTEEQVQLLRERKLKTKGEGIGLMNIEERIKLSFGDQYGVDIHSKEGIGTKVSIRVPYEGV